MISDQIKVLCNENSSKGSIMFAILNLSKDIHESIQNPDFSNIKEEYQNKIFEKSGLKDDEIETIKQKLKNPNIKKEDGDIANDQTQKKGCAIIERLRVFEQSNESKEQLNQKQIIDFDESTFTIDNFNSLSLSKQSSFIEKYSNNNNVNKINKLLLFLKELKYTRCFQIVCEKTEELFIKK